MNEESVVSYFTESSHTLKRMCEQSSSVLESAQLISDALRAGKKVLVCGNGGSASDAQHFAAELVGRFEKNRTPYAAIALNTDSSIITAIANDFGYDEVFSKQIIALGATGDILIAISTSGNSKNILRAVETAKEKNLVTIGLTGLSGSLGGICDISIRGASNRTCHIQETHIATLQLIAQLVENELD